MQVPALVEAKINPEIPELERSETLKPFFERAARVIRGKSERPLRIAFYGDSNLTLDGMSGEMRRILQGQHGDAGHGFVGVGKPWRWYQHQNVFHVARGEWRSYAPSTLNAKDRMYGHAGIAAATRSPGAYAIFRTAKEGDPVGTKVSRFGVFYLKRSQGGTFLIKVDGKQLAQVNTEAETRGVGYHEVAFEDGPHEVKIEADSKKLIRLLGVTMERDSPGIVVDSLGIGGVSFFDLAGMHPDVTRDMLAERKYDLVMYSLGTNLFKVDETRASIKTILEAQRAANPNVSVLLMSPPDQVENKHASVSKRSIKRLSKLLAEISAEHQTAFWDFRQAMGGEASMSKFYWNGLAGGDLYHFTKLGARFMGARITHVIWSDLVKYLTKTPQAGCQE